MALTLTLPTEANRSECESYSMSQERQSSTVYIYKHLRKESAMKQELYHYLARRENSEDMNPEESKDE